MLLGVSIRSIRASHGAKHDLPLSFKNLIAATRRNRVLNKGRVHHPIELIEIHRVNAIIQQIVFGLMALDRLLALTVVGVAWRASRTPSRTSSSKRSWERRHRYRSDAAWSERHNSAGSVRQNVRMTSAPIL